MPAEFDVDDAMRRERRSRAASGSRTADAAVPLIAFRQHGVIARAQLVKVGLAPRAIDRRISAGRLHPIHRGVYAVGHSRLTREGRSMAAVLAGGDDAALSDHSAGALMRLISYSGRVHVTVPKARRNQPGIVWHSSLLPVDEVDRLKSIPITTPARTLLDLSSTLDRHRLGRAIDRAEALRLASPTSLPALLERYPGRRGVAKLREILSEGEIGLRVTNSELEDRFLAFVDLNRLPRPETNVWVRAGDGWVEVDCVWRDARLIVELDGRAYHDTARSFEADRARDRSLIAGGWRVIRVTWRQITREADALAADLQTALLPPAKARLRP